MQIDRAIGRRLRARRKLMKLSFQDLADRLSISADQVKVFEAGGKRISPSMLWKLADVLDMSVIRFFQEAHCEDQETEEMKKMLNQFDTLPQTELVRVLGHMRSLSASKSKVIPFPPNKRLQ